MRLLVIISNPKRASFRQRVAVYLDALRDKGIGSEVVKLPPGSLARQRLFRRAAEFDCVFLHKKSLNYFDAFWLGKYSRKVIYDFDDAIMYSARTPGRNSPAHFKPFHRTVELADMIIAGNSYLAEHARRFNGNVRVLPTGLDTKAYRVRPVPKKDDKVRLVWIGSKSTLRYLAEIRPALEEIGSRLGNVVLRIICDQFFNLQNMPVEKCPWSIETQVPDLVSSDIGLAPLPDNRFTRGKCGFKILQYAAANLPIITSPVGVNSEYVTDGLTGYHASSDRQWVDRTIELIENAKLRRQMGRAACDYVEKFDTDTIGRELCDLLDGCVQEEESLSETCGVSVPSIEVARPPTARTRTVSVCIPTYNRRDYLKETLDSILAQTYKDCEIVIVDDGSTDGTEQMIEQLGIPVTYHWQPNSGDAAARNKLIELARGEYISFIDSDDLLLPDAIERMVRVMETETEDVIVYGSYYRIDERGRVYGRCKRRLHSGRITRHLFETILVHACGSMFPTKVLRESPAFDNSLQICSDYDLWLRLSTKYTFIALDKPTFKRRRHSTNLSQGTFENCLIELQVVDRFYRETGDRQLIPKATAAKVLSRRKCRAGHYAVKEGLYDQACELLGESFRQRPNLKSLVYWTRAVIARRLASP
ncbi:MAG: glycosyltransferase [Phycisphaerales bacterium]|nr:MAG: glycosyltransferase [Phycisphaerales bacterium]